jgi:hypothetical protein
VPALALPELIFIALVFFVLAFAFTSRKLTQAIFGPLIALLQAVPAIGGALAEPFKAIERAIVGACGSIEDGCDSLIGAAWHTTARLLDWSWKELRSHAGAILALAGPVSLVLTIVHGIRALVHQLTRAVHAVTAGSKTLERDFSRLQKRVNAFERSIETELARVIRPEIKTLTNELAHVEDVVIPDIRDIALGVGADLTALKKWIADNIPLIGTTAFAGAVAWALSNIGLGGLSCSNLKNLLNKWGCGLGKVLDDLLGLMVSVLALEAVCEFLPLIEDAFGLIVGPLVHLLNEVPLGKCEQPDPKWAQLSVAAGPLPPAQSLGTLPS